MAKPIMGGANPRNARAMLEAGEISQAEYDDIMKAKKKGARKKSRSLFDVIKGAMKED